MSGEELKRKLKDAGYSQAEIARLLGVIPQSFNQSLDADDIKSGMLEKICKAINKDMSFFYDIKPNVTVIDGSDNEVAELKEQIEELKEQNKQLKKDLYRAYDPEQPKKDSKIYKLWMKFMEITCEWQELYKEEKDLQNNEKQNTTPM